MQITISNELLLIIALALALVLVLVFLIPAARHKPDTPHEGEPTVEEFPDKHVHVTVPWQGYAVKILRVPYPPPGELPSIKVADRPWPHQVLLNVVVARQEDHDVLVTHYDPPLTLKMAYSMEALERAKEAGLEYPVFGFWDGCQWVLFTKEKHRLSYDNASDPTAEIAGYAMVELAAWNDPAIAHGP